MWKCYRCGKELEDSINICTGCGAGKNTFDTAAPDTTVQTEPEDKNLVRAIIFGLVAAVVSSVVWYGAVVITGYQLGILAIGVGWLIASAVVMGSGGKRGPAYQFISVILIVIAMGLSEYLVVRHFLNQELVKRGIEELPLLVSFQAILEMIWLSVKESPLTLLFWGIAIYEGITLPAAKSITVSAPVETGVEK
jgi:hypothetical protein